MGDEKDRDALIKEISDRLWNNFELYCMPEYSKFGCVIAEIVMDYVDERFAELEKKNG